MDQKLKIEENMVDEEYEAEKRLYANGRVCCICMEPGLPARHNPDPVTDQAGHFFAAGDKCCIECDSKVDAKRLNEVLS